jgi:hypothetical protein
VLVKTSAHVYALKQQTTEIKYTPSVPIYLKFLIYLSQTSLKLTKSMENYIKIYTTKLVLLYLHKINFHTYIFDVADVFTFFTHLVRLKEV